MRSPRALGLPLLSAIVLLTLAGSASADEAVSQPGEVAGQTRSPQGLAGVGAGEFDSVSNNNGLSEIGVDNDPASPSHHDVYVLERDETDYENVHTNEGRGYRVQKFDPEGHFLLTFGGGVITGGAKGAGDLVAGSKEVTGVQTIEKVFEVSQGASKDRASAEFEAHNGRAFSSKPLLKAKCKGKSPKGKKRRPKP